MRMSKSFLPVLILLFALFSCASKEPESVVDEKVSGTSVSPVAPPSTLPIEDAINKNAQLTKTEKKELLGVVYNVRDKNVALTEERQKLNKVIFKEMMNADDPGQVNVLKQKILATEKKKVQNFLEGVDQFENILKNSDAKHDMMMHAIRMDATIMSGGAMR